MNLDTLVIGKDDKGYKCDEWHASDTSWQRRQSNLLIADKQLPGFKKRSYRSGIYAEDVKARYGLTNYLLYVGIFSP